MLPRMTCPHFLRFLMERPYQTLQKVLGAKNGFRSPDPLGCPFRVWEFLGIAHGGHIWWVRLGVWARWFLRVLQSWGSGRRELGPRGGGQVNKDSQLGGWLLLQDCGELPVKQSHM